MNHDEVVRLVVREAESRDNPERADHILAISVSEILEPGSGSGYTRYRSTVGLIDEVDDKQLSQEVKKMPTSVFRKMMEGD
jgi:hypothetical protein